MTAELITAPDVAMVLIHGLRDACPFPVVTFGRGVSPNPRMDRMVMLTVDYGRRINVAQQEGVARVNVWDKDYQAALDVAQWTAGQLLILADGKPVQKVDNQYGPVEIADESRQTRLYLTVDLVFRISERR